MAPPLDLSGRKFGLLTATKDAGYELHGTKKYNYWWCSCACGREIKTRTAYLIRGSRVSCDVCLRGPCVVCGGEIIEETKRNTCCEDCFLTHRRNKDLKYYSKKISTDPNYNKTRAEQIKKKLTSNPTAHEEFRKKQRERSRLKRLKLTESELEKDREKSKARYEERREIILLGRKLRQTAMSAEDRSALTERNRELNREWRRKWRAELAKDPMAYEEYLSYAREAGRKSYAKKSLSSLFETAQKLGERINENDSGESKA